MSLNRSIEEPMQWIVDKILNDPILPESIKCIVLDKESRFVSVDIENVPSTLIPQIEFRLKQSINTGVRITGGHKLVNFLESLSSDCFVKEFFITRKNELVTVVYSRTANILSYMFVESESDNKKASD